MMRNIARISNLYKRYIPPPQLLLAIHSNNFSSTSNEGTFVSKYSVLSSREFEEIAEIMKNNRIDVRRGSNGSLEVKECPSTCSKENKSKADNIWKFKINIDGSFHCFRCNQHGNRFELRRRITGAVHHFISSSRDVQEEERSDNKTAEFRHTKLNLPSQREAFHYHLNLFPSNIGTIPTDIEVDEVVVGTDDGELLKEDIKHSRKLNTEPAYKYLIEKRGLTLETCKIFGIGLKFEDFPVEVDAPLPTEKNTDTTANDAGVGGVSKKKLIVKPKWKSEACLTFPWICPIKDLTPIELKAFNELPENMKKKDAVSIILRTKVRAFSTKGKQRLLPSGGTFGFFGWHLVEDHHKQIIITEGEFDAMAVYQALHIEPISEDFKDIPVVSLPNGCNSLPPELIAKLEVFEKIYLWMDNDTPGIAASEKFTKKLGPARCFRVRPLQTDPSRPKDANEALLAKVDIVAMLKKATTFLDEKIQTFADFRHEILLPSENDSNVAGTPAKSLEKFTQITKGFRRGELVVLTGPTGSGKTTFLSQVSLDFAKIGKAVLWGSFEIKNVQLAKKLFMQYLKICDLSLLPQHKKDLAANDFEEFPIFFLKYFGGSPINEVIEAMELAVHKYDIEHIIIDNLQFMLPRSNVTNNKFEKLDLQDGFIDKFRQFATEKAVNVILVIHPVKIDEDRKLTINNIGGSAKATQEADMVLILQRIEGSMSIDIKKNRYDGELGSVELEFSKATNLYFEKTQGFPGQNTSSSNVSKYKKKKVAAATTGVQEDTVVPTSLVNSDGQEY